MVLPKKKGQMYHEVRVSEFVRVWVCMCACATSMSACQSVYLPVCTLLYWRIVRRTEHSTKGGPAVSQCWLSGELMGAGREAVGGPKPCTIQASFRWSTATGAQHHKILSNTHAHMHTLAKMGGGCILKLKLPQQILTSRLQSSDMNTSPNPDKNYNDQVYLSKIQHHSHNYHPISSFC